MNYKTLHEIDQVAAEKARRAALYPELVAMVKSLLVVGIIPNVYRKSAEELLVKCEAGHETPT